MQYPTALQPSGTAQSIRFVDVAKHFGGVTAVESFNLTIEPGQFVTLLGPSGCGKSTTLNMIAGLELPSEGRILIGERDVTAVSPADRDIAMVFQSYALYPHLTIFENIAFPLRARRRRTSEADVTTKVRDAAMVLGLDKLLDAIRARSRAGSVSAWPSVAPWSAVRLSTCSTSRFPILTNSCGFRCARS